MGNRQKYNQIFMEIFSVKEDELRELTNQSVTGWDSRGHFNLIDAIEENFDVMLDTEDIVKITSYEKGIEILEKYGVSFS